MTWLKVKNFLPIIMGSLLLTHCSCDFFGTAGALLISEDDEVELGREFDLQLRTKDTAGAYPIYVPRNAEETAFQNYVLGLAEEVLAAVPAKERPDYDFTFTLIDKDVENAFAVPGGYVYIYTGIIKKMKDESELVGVLGHEIAHVTRHHYRDAMAKDAGLSLILQALLGNDAGQLAQLVAGSLYSMAGLKVSQSNESEADFYGTRYTAATERNPLGIAKFFGRFDSQGSLASWFSTHPDPPDRVSEVRSQVNGSDTFKQLASDSLTTNYQSRFEQRTQVIR